MNDEVADIEALQAALLAARAELAVVRARREARDGERVVGVGEAEDAAEVGGQGERCGRLRRFARRDG